MSSNTTRRKYATTLFLLPSIQTLLPLERSTQISTPTDFRMYLRFHRRVPRKTPRKIELLSPSSQRWCVRHRWIHVDVDRFYLRWHRNRHLLLGWSQHQTRTSRVHRSKRIRKVSPRTVPGFGPQMLEHPVFWK